LITLSTAITKLSVTIKFNTCLTIKHEKQKSYCTDKLPGKG